MFRIDNVSSSIVSPKKQTISKPTNWFCSHIEPYGDGDYGTPGELAEPYLVVEWIDFPEQVVPGGELICTIHVQNPTLYDEAADAWIKASSIAEIEVGLFDLIGYMFVSGFDIEYSMTFAVHAAAPLGNYEISADLGDYFSDFSWYGDSFEVEVVE